jgi:hypothetical protein
MYILLTPIAATPAPALVPEPIAAVALSIVVEIGKSIAVDVS